MAQSSISRRLTPIFWIAILLAGIGYIVQLVGPLRLNSDVMDFLSMVRSAEAGEGFYVTKGTERYPPGYPAILLVLTRAGWGDEYGFVGLNLLTLALALASVYGVARLGPDPTPGVPALVVLLTLMSFIVIKHVTLSLSDVPFFGLSLSALYAARRAEMINGRSRWIWLGAALAITGAATLVRTVGVALLPALLWAGAGRTLGLRLTLLTAGQRYAVAILLTVSIAIGVASIALFGGLYLTLGLSRIANGELWHTWLGRLTELGEIAINVPETRLPLLSPFFGIGAVALCALWAAGWWRFRRRLPTTPDIYLATYASIMLLWTYNDNRYWLPVLPLVWLTVSAALQPWLSASWVRIIVGSALGWNILAGAAALAYSTTLSLSGEGFVHRYGPPLMQEAYQIAWGLEAPASVPADVHDMVDILRRYDRRAQRAVVRDKTELHSGSRHMFVGAQSQSQAESGSLSREPARGHVPRLIGTSIPDESLASLCLPMSQSASLRATASANQKLRWRPPPPSTIHAGSERVPVR